jgi:PIN domain nuclease of toxin-antitoxin system
MTADSIALLDASAMVAVLFQEPGHEVVETILESGRAATTPLALAEALNVCRRKGHVFDNAKLRAVLARDGLHVEPVEEADVEGMLDALARADDHRRSNPKRRGGTLSLADAACIAMGKRLGLPVVTSDRMWVEAEFDGVAVRRFR